MRKTSIKIELGCQKWEASCLMKIVEPNRKKKDFLFLSGKSSANERLSQLQLSQWKVTVVWTLDFSKVFSGHCGASLVAQTLNNPLATRETWVWSLSREDPLEKGMTTYFSTLAWRIPWTEKPCYIPFHPFKRVLLSIFTGDSHMACIRANPEVKFSLIPNKPIFPWETTSSLFILGHKCILLKFYSHNFVDCR